MERCVLKRNSLSQNLSLALGANLITPLDLAASYSVFPNGGYKIEPYFIDKIVDYNGNTIQSSSPKVARNDIDYNTETVQQASQAISTQISYLVTSLLQDVITTGTGKKQLNLVEEILQAKQAKLMINSMADMLALIEI